MPDTTYLKMTYPEENKDPHYDDLVALYGAIDERIYGLLNTTGNIIVPADGLSWNPGTKTLSWTGEFEIVIVKSGFSLKIPFGPDGINKSVTFLDGERLIVTVPSTSGGEVTANLAKISGAINTINPGLLILGFCRGTSFYANFPQVYT